MFTGLVEEIGEVSELNPQDATGGTSLTISLPTTSTLLYDAQLGDSIAVNGVCLTATSLTATASDASPQPSFTVGIAPETLRLTNLGALTQGSRVNLERAVRADTRMGGHFVQGHVDTTAAIESVTQDGNAKTFRFRPAARDMLRYIVFKGYVTIDGTSLTVTKVDDAAGWFEVMLIAYTQEKVVVAGKKPGDTVNIEVDVLAKYAEKSMQGYMNAKVGGGDHESGSEPALKAVVEKMVQNVVAQAMGAHSA
ncbi:riboflavin synthase-like protein [Apiospora marii]|uniref:Riboflavin synthase-like protein n=1 Tax=Apiospora marii TaxID=335849 RepID=A0ABR1SG22_9PEZI